MQNRHYLPYLNPGLSSYVASPIIWHPPANPAQGYPASTWPLYMENVRRYSIASGNEEIVRHGYRDGKKLVFTESNIQNIKFILNF